MNSFRHKLFSIIYLVLLTASLSGLTFLFNNSKPQSIQINSEASSGDITVDFQSRLYKKIPIQHSFLGVGGLGIANVLPTVNNYVKSANIITTRNSITLEKIFPNQSSLTNSSQQSWSDLDSRLTLIQNAGMEPILILDYTPAWLQPQNQNPPLPNPCLTNAQKSPAQNIMPIHMVNGVNEGPSLWGQAAAVVVNHIDKNYPSMQVKYEFWNEPDGSGYACKSDSDTNAETERLDDWKNLVATAGPLMRAQAKTDGKQIVMGGPALAWVEKRADTWFPSITTDPRVYPYLDFISYHLYIGGANWSSLLAATRSSTGEQAEYQHVAKLIRQGKQVNASSTPILIDEFNTGPWPGCCRNDKTYAPLWQSVIMSDWINSTFNTSSPYGAAQEVPILSYFAWDFTPPQNYCMFATIDSAMDCAFNGSVVPYPSYYTYNLMGNSSYLDISNNAYVVPNPSIDKSDVLISSFLSGNKDNIFLINTGGTNYSGLTLSLQNPGLTTVKASVFTLDGANPTIATNSIGINTSGNSLTGQVNIPAFSTVGISLIGSGVTQTPTPTPTQSSTPTPSVTHSVTPTPSTSITNTPSSSVTPSVTMSQTPTPSNGNNNGFPTPTPSQSSVQINNTNGTPIKNAIVSFTTCTGSNGSTSTDQNGNILVPSCSTIQSINDNGKTIPVNQKLNSNENYKISIDPKKGVVTNILGYKNVNYYIYATICILIVLLAGGIGYFMYKKKLFNRNRHNGTIKI